MKIFGSPPNKNKYKKYATGNITSDGTGLVNVTSLNFSPDVVIAKGSDGTFYKLYSLHNTGYSIPTSGNFVGAMANSHITGYNVNGNLLDSNGNNNNLLSNGFRFYTGASINFTFKAYGI
jgi:hypothetical protein